MKTPTLARALLVSVIAISPINAFPYDSSFDDLSDAIDLQGIESRDAGTEQTFNIPTSSWPIKVRFSLRGGDGGRAKAIAAVGSDKSANGGGGALVAAEFYIDPNTVGALKPGGEIKIMVGSRGESQSNKDDIASGGGGGATGVLYRPPVENADWELLMVAGGGGGACASTAVTQTFAKEGENANTGINGDDAGNAAPGGTNGTGGIGYQGGAGAGAGWLTSAGDDQGGKKFSAGGVGGSPNNDGVNGGFGISGGGAGHRKLNSTNHQGGGGGGGGYSGGGAGSDDENNATAQGGGGGSFTASFAQNVSSSTRNGSQENGYAQVTYADNSIGGTLSAPIITLVGETTIFLDENEPFTEPGFSASDVYGNSLSASSSEPAGLSQGTPGTYKITYQATDQFGQTGSTVRNITIVDLTAPSFDITGNLSVYENSGAQSFFGFASNFDPNDSGQFFSHYTVTNNNTALFLEQPAATASGKLTFTPASNTFGSATVTITGFDTGSYDNSSQQTFTITVVESPHPPTFSLQGDLSVIRDAGAQTFANFAYDFNANDSGQSLDRYEVSASTPALFSAQPAIDSTGALTFTPLSDSFGATLVTVTAYDDGPLNNSSQMSFTLTITDVQPVASFIASKTLTLPGKSIQFTDTSSDAAGWAWDFDNDGTTDSNEQNPIHSYASAGTYTVSLVATNTAGEDTVTSTNPIRVAPFGIVNADFSSTDFANGSGTASSLGTGWYGKSGDDGSVTSPDWSTGQTAGSAGVLTHLQTSGSATRFGQFFGNQLTGDNWALSFDLGGTGSFHQIRLYAGTLADQPSGTVLKNDTGEPDLGLVDGNGWTSLLYHPEVYADGTVIFHLSEDLGQFDVMAIQFRSDAADNGTTFDNFAFVTQENFAANDDSFSIEHQENLNKNVLGNDTGGTYLNPLEVTAVNGDAAKLGSQISLASGALLTVSADGSFNYDPNGVFDSLSGGTSTNDSFTYTLSNGSSTDSGTVTLSITNVDDPPENITLSQNQVVENSTIVGTVSATDPDGSPDGNGLYFILEGGDDRLQFTLDYQTGELSFKTAPNFEQANDANGDNVYEITVLVRPDSGPGTTQSFSITVTDELEVEEFRIQYNLASDGSDDHADWSGNGLANIHYFAFGLGDPNEVVVDRDRLPLVIEGETADTLQFCYVRPIGSGTLLEFTIVTSNNLSDWFTPDDLGPDYHSVESSESSLGDGYQKVMVTFPIQPGEANRFYTLGVQDSTAP